MPEPETPREPDVPDPDSPPPEDEPEDARAFEEAPEEVPEDEIEIVDEGPEKSPNGSPDGTSDAGPEEKADERLEAEKPRPDAPREDDAPRRDAFGAGERKTASAGAIERLKARAARDSARSGGSANSKAARSSRRRLSDPEREALWQKAVAQKARKIKILTDLLIFLCLGCVLGSHALVFAHKRANLGGGMDIEYGPKRGYEVMLDLVKLNLEGESDAPLVRVGTKPLMIREGGALRVFEPAAPADVLSVLILVVPVGAALLFLLYLLDFLVWMGRPLPVLSFFYGFGSVAYLMITRVPENGAWNLVGTGGREAVAAWFMLLIPLFLLGTFSMLRLFFSARRKRYAYAGLEPPAKPAPAAPPVPAAEAPAARGARGAPGEAPPTEPPAAAGEGAPPAKAADGVPAANEDLRATPVSSPAIRLESPAGGGRDDAEPPRESSEEPPPADG